jgi:hypothetical protein
LKPGGARREAARRRSRESPVRKHAPKSLSFSLPYGVEGWSRSSGAEGGDEIADAKVKFASLSDISLLIVAVPVVGHRSYAVREKHLSIAEQFKRLFQRIPASG